jgi:hypothetical protein
MIRSLAGWVKDKPDGRDLLVKDLLAALPPVTAPDSYRCVSDPQIMDQGGTSECVVYAHTLARIIQERLEGAPVPIFDTHALYEECKRNDFYPGEGTYPTVCCDIMLKKGMPVAGSTPGCWAKFWAPKVESAFDPQYKLGAYWRLTPDLTIEQIKQAIFLFGPITSACNWDERWMSMFGQSIFPEPSGRYDGGHCVCQQGYNTVGIEYDNSWGRFQWGVGGIATMPWEMYLEHVLKGGDVIKLQDSTAANKAFRSLIK